MSQAPRSAAPRDTADLDAVSNAVEDRLTDLLDLAAPWLATRRGRAFARPTVRYFDTRLEAGRATAPLRKGEPGLIELNRIYLETEREAMLGETIAHELAHLLVFHLEPRRNLPPHGELWQSIMRDWFGVEPQRTHDFDTDAVPARRQRRWRYVCACTEHELSTVRHKRIVRGVVYHCRRCNQPLAPMVQQELFA